MNQQEILDTFIREVNGKGQATESGSSICVYDIDDHPGCAIGCQPRFKEKVLPLLAEDQEGGIKLLRNRKDVEEALIDAFEIKDDDDWNFLEDVQVLHDNRHNWDGTGMRLKYLAVKQFANSWGIEVTEDENVFA